MVLRKIICVWGVLMMLTLAKPVNAQSASKCFEYAKMYEDQKNYTTALYWYHAGSLKGSAKNNTLGKEGYFRIMPLSLKEKYDSASQAADYDVKLKLFRKAGKFLKKERSLWEDEKDKRKIVPDWTQYSNTLTELTKPKLDEGEQTGTREAMEAAYNLVTRYLAEQRSLFDFQDEKKHVSIRFDEEAYKKRIQQLGCGDVSKIVMEAQASYVAGTFRDAYVKASAAKESVEYYNCTDDRPANIMQQALANGGISVAVLPVKGQENLRKIDKDIVSSIQSMEDPFVSGKDPQALENQLLEKDISIEDTYTADIVSLSKLGKLFGFNCIVTGKILLADAGNGNITTKQFTAYKVSSDNYGKFAHEPVSFTEHTGKQISRYKAQIKIVDLKTKAILYSDIIDYSYTDEIHYAVSPVKFSGLSQREFDNYKETTGSVGSDLLSAVGASIAPADVQKWRPKWVELEDQRKNFIGQEEIMKSFSMKIAEQVRAVIERNYGVK